MVGQVSRLQSLEGVTVGASHHVKVFPDTPAKKLAIPSALVIPIMAKLKNGRWNILKFSHSMSMWNYELQV